MFHLLILLPFTAAMHGPQPRQTTKPVGHAANLTTPTSHVQHVRAIPTDVPPAASSWFDFVSQQSNAVSFPQSAMDAVLAWEMSATELSSLITATAPTDPCVDPTASLVPASLSSAYAALQSAQGLWASEYMSLLVRYQDEYKEAKDEIGALETATDVCSSWKAYATKLMEEQGQVQSGGAASSGGGGQGVVVGAVLAAAAMLGVFLL